MFSNIWTALEPWIFILAIPLSLIWFFWQPILLAFIVWQVLKSLTQKRK